MQVVCVIHQSKISLDVHINLISMHEHDLRM